MSCYGHKVRIIIFLLLFYFVRVSFCIGNIKIVSRLLVFYFYAVLHTALDLEHRMETGYTCPSIYAYLLNLGTWKCIFMSATTIIINFKIFSAKWSSSSNRTKILKDLNSFPLNFGKIFFQMVGVGNNIVLPSFT